MLETLVPTAPARTRISVFLPPQFFNQLGSRNLEYLLQLQDALLGRTIGWAGSATAALPLIRGAFGNACVPRKGINA